MKLNMDQFIDLCILMGCDFLPTLPKIGKQRAYDLMKEYGSIEKIIASLDKTKYPIPENYNYEGVRQLFKVLRSSCFHSFFFPPPNPSHCRSLT